MLEVSEPRTLVDSAATSALFSPEIVVVRERRSLSRGQTGELPRWPARLLMTEVSCVLLRAPTCVLLNEVAVSAPN